MAHDQKPEFEPGTNTAFYELEARVCTAILNATPEKLKTLAARINRRGSSALVRELADLLGLEE